MEYRKIIAGFESDNPALAEELICDMFFSSGVNGVVCHLPLAEPDEGFGTPTPIVPDGNRIDGYLPETLDADKILAQLNRRAEALAQDGIHVSIQTETVADQDWAHAWKEHFHVIRITDRMVVKPAWKPFDPDPDDLVIHLDPGMAFGTGTHPSTCMCLKQIQAELTPGQTFLDVGCGSGILMIAAARLGASRMAGIDTDPAAVAVAKENLEKNEVPADQYHLWAGTLDQMDATQYDLIGANIIAQTLVAIMGDIRLRMAPDGRAVLSGIILERLPDVETALKQQGLIILTRDTDAEWVTITVGREPCD
ncbi:MAG: 50S ribosomal protein L11 methyltransferase [Desulfotignum sp.]|nr:50S ribosomal protein L11 methyltransferase [Desulfotignum sp.]MCF8138701.1 50S ribosomal protein L11 methyltransferase [Desulfotignum sp.]